MATMKSRSLFPPGEWQVLHPEVGMREPFKGSFTEAVEFEARFRMANPGIVQQNGWGYGKTEIENYVDEYNAIRMSAHGWTEFLDEGATFPDLAVTQEAEKKSRSAALVDKSKALRAGAATYREMFGKDGVVDQQEAERRAGICVVCPLNDTSKSLWAWFVEGAAREISQVIEYLKGIHMETKHDDKLGVCKACLCPMRAKVWAKLDHILEHMPDSDTNKLDKNCWIINT